MSASRALRFGAAEAPRVLRYGLVSLFCAGLHNLIVIGAVYAGWGYVAGAILSNVVLAPISYVLNVALVFRTRADLRQFITYALTLTLNVPAVILLLFLFQELLGLPIVAASPAVSVVMFVWNYVAGRVITGRGAGGAAFAARSRSSKAAYWSPAPDQP